MEKSANIPVLFLGFLFLFGISFAGGATSCDLNAETCTFTITINIAFDSGADAGYRANAERAIEDFWNNAGGTPPTYGECKCLVKFEVNTKSVQDCDKEASTDWHCIKVTPFATKPPVDTAGKKYIGYMYPPGVSTGQNLTGWWSDGMDGPAPGGGNYADFAHEAGHLMGLEDGDGGIMSNTTPGQATQSQAQIDEIMRDACGGKSCPDRCCCGNGKVDKSKGEQCDPVANPCGCGATESCCPYCCQCEPKQCDPAAGEYATEADCKKNCGPDASGTQQQCSFNYWTGCWICIPVGYETIISATDPSKIRECPKCDHNASGVAPPPAGNQTLNRKEKGEEAAKEVSKIIAGSPMLSTLFGNERVNLYVEGLGEFHAVLLNGEIVEFGEGLLPDPTMNVFTDEQTMWMLANGDIMPTEALNRGLISYEGVGFVEGFKFWLSQTLFEWFVPYEGPGPQDPSEGVLVGERII